MFSNISLTFRLQTKNCIFQNSRHEERGIEWRRQRDIDSVVGSSIRYIHEETKYSQATNTKSRLYRICVFLFDSRSIYRIWCTLNICMKFHLFHSSSCIYLRLHELKNSAMQNSIRISRTMKRNDLQVCSIFLLSI